MNIRILLLLLLVSIVTPNVGAISPTATASDTPSATKKMAPIDDLKERLATKVAELRQSQKKAIFGTVKAVTISTITLETKTSDVKIEITDDIKVFQTLKDKRTELSTDDIEKGDFIVVFGDYDTSLDLMKSKVIVIQNPASEKLHGIVTAIDAKEYTISVETTQKQTYVIDIEKYTTVASYSTSGGTIKSGFSKIALGETVFISGKLHAKIEHRLSAERILDIGNLTGTTPTPTTSPEPSPVASSSATPKATPTKN